MYMPGNSCQQSNFHSTPAVQTLTSNLCSQSLHMSHLQEMAIQEMILLPVFRLQIQKATGSKLGSNAGTKVHTTVSLFRQHFQKSGLLSPIVSTETEIPSHVQCTYLNRVYLRSAVRMYYSNPAFGKGIGVSRHHRLGQPGQIKLPWSFIYLNSLGISAKGFFNTKRALSRVSYHIVIQSK